MTTPLLEFAPYKNRMVNETGFITGPWREWFQLTLVTAVQLAPAVADTPINLINQSASIGLTPVIESPNRGIYRASVFSRVVQAATTSSALQVSLTATDGAVPYTKSTANATTNTTDTVLEQTFVIRTDAGAPIDYSVTYASVGGTPMKFELAVVVEQVA